jgi:hypothetical protein
MRNERGPGGGRQVLVTDLGPWRHIFFPVKFGCHLANNKVVGFVYIIINLYTNYGPLSLFWNAEPLDPSLQQGSCMRNRRWRLRRAE